VGNNHHELDLAQPQLDQGEKGGEDHRVSLPTVEFDDAASKAAGFSFLGEGSANQAIE
jgi:hypothetical protein